MKMSGNVLVSTSLIFSSSMVILSNSWVITWILLELNTLAFCSLVKFEKNLSSKSAEPMMKYFVVQSIASAMLVYSSYAASEGPLFVVMGALSISAIMLKLASAPVHSWFITVSKMLHWDGNTILMTWQKGAPIFLILSQIKTLTAPFFVASMVVGSLSQLNKLNVKEILAFSSVFNLAWMLLASLLNPLALLVFCLIYWASVWLIFQIMKASSKKEMKINDIEKSNKWLNILVIGNLSGFPPLPNFVSKWFTLKESLLLNMKAMVTTALIFSSVNLFIYMRLFAESFLKNRSASPHHPTKNNKGLYALSLTTSILPMPLLLL